MWQGKLRRSWTLSWMQPRGLRRQTDAGKLPSSFGGKEIAVAGADVRRRRATGTAAQDHLPAHKLAIIFTQRAVEGLESRIAEVGAASPHPTIPVPLRGVLVFDEIGGDRCEVLRIQQISLDGLALRGKLPFELGGQPLAGP